MYDPMKAGKQFGSELHKRQTPEFAEKERRSWTRTLYLGLGIGLLLFAMGVHGIGTGEVFRGTKSGTLDVNGWVVAAVGLGMTGLSGWALLRRLFGRKP